ncbi:hypothetical protein D3C76_1291260 [compost metagenome]
MAFSNTSGRVSHRSRSRLCAACWPKGTSLTPAITAPSSQAKPWPRARSRNGMSQCTPNQAIPLSWLMARLDRHSGAWANCQPSSRRARAMPRWRSSRRSSAVSRLASKHWLQRANAWSSWSRHAWYRRANNGQSRQPNVSCTCWCCQARKPSTPCTQPASTAHSSPCE